MVSDVTKDSRPGLIDPIDGKRSIVLDDGIYTRRCWVERPRQYQKGKALVFRTFCPPSHSAWLITISLRCREANSCKYCWRRHRLRRLDLSVGDVRYLCLILGVSVEVGGLTSSEGNTCLLKASISRRPSVAPLQ